MSGILKIDIKNHEGLLEKVPWNVEEEDDDDVENEEENVKKKIVKKVKEDEEKLSKKNVKEERVEEKLGKNNAKEKEEEKPRKKDGKSESESGAKNGAVDHVRRRTSGSSNLRGKLRDLTGISLTGRKMSVSSAAAAEAEAEPRQARRPYSWRNAVTKASNRVRRASMRMLKKREKGLTG